MSLLQRIPSMEPKYEVYHDTTGNTRPVVASVASPGLRQILDEFQYWEEAGELAIKTVEYQLKTHNEHLKDVRARIEVQDTPLQSAARDVARKISQDDPKNGIEAILAEPDATTRRAILKLENIPYSVVCAIRAVGHAVEPERKRTRGAVTEATDIDEWWLPLRASTKTQTHLDVFKDH